MTTPAPPDPGAVGAARRRKPPSVRTAVRRERRRLAQTLHNTLCQELTGVSLLASAAARQQRGVCPEAERQLREIAELLRHAAANLQTFVRSLHPEG